MCEYVKRMSCVWMNRAELSDHSNEGLRWVSLRPGAEAEVECSIYSQLSALFLSFSGSTNITCGFWLRSNSTKGLNLSL